jgi:hypothetical protein
MVKPGPENEVRYLTALGVVGSDQRHNEHRDTAEGQELAGNGSNLCLFLTKTPFGVFCCAVSVQASYLF